MLYFDLQYAQNNIIQDYRTCQVARSFPLVFRIKTGKDEKTGLEIHTTKHLFLLEH